jgi:hypothetical protein
MKKLTLCAWFFISFVGVNAMEESEFSFSPKRWDDGQESPSSDLPQNLHVQTPELRPTATRRSKRSRSQDRDLIKRAYKIRKNRPSSRGVTPFYQPWTPQRPTESSSSAIRAPRSIPVEVRPTDKDKITLHIPKRMLQESSMTAMNDYFEFEAVVERNGKKKKALLFKIDQNY